MYCYVYPGTVMVGESAYSYKMLGDLGALIRKIRKAADSACVGIDDLKELLLYSYPSEKEEIQKAQNISQVFLVIREKLCTPDNIDVLKLIVHEFKLSDVLGDIQKYEEENKVNLYLLSYC